MKRVRCISISLNGYDVWAFHVQGIIEPEALHDGLIPVPRSGQGVILYGRVPTWLMAYAATHVPPTSPWIGVYDPKLQAAVIVHSRVKELQEGDRIPLHEGDVSQIQEQLKVAASDVQERESDELAASIRLAIVGPPHSGKSVFSYALQRALDACYPEDVYLLRAVPDGEGNWFHELPSGKAMLYRQKGRWSNAFVTRMEEAIKRLSKQKRFVLVDTGGKIDSYTRRLLSACTHAFIVSRSPEETCLWQGAVQAAGAELVGIIHSSLEPVGELLEEGPPPVWRIGPLERGKHPSIPDGLLRSVRGFT